VCGGQTSATPFQSAPYWLQFLKSKPGYTSISNSILPACFRYTLQASFHTSGKIPPRADPLHYENTSDTHAEMIPQGDCLPESSLYENQNQGYGG